MRMNGWGLLPDGPRTAREGNDATSASHTSIVEKNSELTDSGAIAVQVFLAWSYSAQISVPCVSFKNREPSTSVMAATIIG